MMMMTMINTHKLGHRWPLGAPILKSIRVGIAGSITRHFPHIHASLDRWLSIGRDMFLCPLVAPGTGTHCHIPATLHMRQYASILQRFTRGRFLKDSFAIHLRVVVQSTRNEGDDKDATQGPFAAAAFLLLRILFILFLLCAALLLHGLRIEREKERRGRCVKTQLKMFEMIICFYFLFSFIYLLRTAGLFALFALFGFYLSHNWFFVFVSFLLMYIIQF